MGTELFDLDLLVQVGRALDKGDLIAAHDLMYAITTPSVWEQASNLIDEYGL